MWINKFFEENCDGQAPIWAIVSRCDYSLVLLKRALKFYIPIYKLCNYSFSDREHNNL